jgi:hypothetical protein
LTEAVDWPAAISAVEAALAADGVGRPRPPTAPLPPDVELAARCAVAAKFLAVGTPRTFGAIGLGARADLFVAAQAAWAPAREIRTWSAGDPTAALDAALAADIVVAAGPLAVPRAAVRGGTHLATLDPTVVLAPDLVAAALLYDVHRLAAVVAGLVDGRQLDEITVLVCEG